MMNENITLSYDQDSHTVVGRWMLPVEGRQFQETYEHMLDYACEKNCNRWLVDVRRRVKTNPTDLAWVISDYIPKCLTFFDHMYIAYFISPDAMTAFNSGPDKKIHTSDNITYFITSVESEAQQWLAESVAVSR